MASVDETKHITFPGRLMVRSCEDGLSAARFIDGQPLIFACSSGRWTLHNLRAYDLGRM
jgi:hypothetical protein